MSDVTIRELRHHGGEVVDRVARGEQITITRGGKPVAQLHPAAPPGLTAATLLDRWKSLPRVDPTLLRADLDELLDADL